MITGRSRGDREIAYGFLLAAAILAPRISAADFVRGDVDGNCQVQWGDASWVIAYLLLGKSDEVRCLEAALDGITRGNAGTARIHTVAVGEVTGIRKEFLVELARRNAGMHAHVTE